MCVLALSFRSQPGYDLILIANRDEYFDRPAEPARFWPDHPEILGGRDLRSGGTWLGVTRSGRVALVTNYRDPRLARSSSPSRGLLVRDFLARATPQREALEELVPRLGAYSPFNLLAGASRQLFYLSSVEGRPRELAPGFYGMSNHLLETPWPKVARVKEGMSRILGAARSQLPVEELLALLRDDRPAPDRELPETGVGPERERALSPIFVTMPAYGTRCSTVLGIRSHGAATLVERTYSGDRSGVSTVRFDFVCAFPTSAESF